MQRCPGSFDRSVEAKIGREPTAMLPGRAQRVTAEVNKHAIRKDFLFPDSNGPLVKGVSFGLRVLVDLNSRFYTGDCIYFGLNFPPYFTPIPVIPVLQCISGADGDDIFRRIYILYVFAREIAGLLGNETSEFANQPEELLFFAGIFAYSLNKNSDCHFATSFL
jgi:hypothetical protein